MHKNKIVSNVNFSNEFKIIFKLNIVFNVYNYFDRFKFGNFLFYSMKLYYLFCNKYVLNIFLILLYN